MEDEDPAHSSNQSLAATPSPDTFLRFRLSHIETVLVSATSIYDVKNSPFYADDLKIVPSIRIFGATDRGQRVVAHVAGTFPYSFIEYKGKLDPETVNAYIYRLGRSLNEAVSESYLAQNYDRPKSARYVSFITLCKATPFYGYAIGYRQYLKIHIVDPKHKKRIGACLRAGLVMNTVFEVFEEHIPHMLQFMLDSNLYGCGWVEVADCRFRHPLPEPIPASATPESCNGPFATRLYNTSTIPPHLRHSISTGPAKESHCPLEIDLSVASILNRRALAPRDLHHDYIERLHPETISQEKLVYSVKELWDDEKRRRMALGEKGPYGETDTGPPRDWDGRPVHEPMWQSEPEYQQKVNALVHNDLLAFQSRPGLELARPMFESYVSDLATSENVEVDWQAQVRTTFQQVDAIHPERMRKDELECYPYGTWAVKVLGLRGQNSVGSGRAMSRSVSPVKRGRSASPGRAGGIYDDSDDEFEMDGEGGSFAVRDQGVMELKVKQDRRTKERQEEEWGDEIEEEDDQVGDPDLVEWEQPEGEEVAMPWTGSSSSATNDHGKRAREESEEAPVAVESPTALERSFALSTTSSPIQNPASSTNVFQPPLPRPRSSNPFLSPTKPSRVRFANDTLPIEEHLPLQSPQQYDEMNLDDLPSDTFEEYAPTPTIYDPIPSRVPDHDLSTQSDIEGGLVASASTNVDASQVSKEVASSCGSGVSKRVEFDIPAESPSHASSLENDQVETLVKASGTTESTAIPMSSFASTKSSEHRLMDTHRSKKYYALSSNSFAWSASPPSTSFLINSIESYRLSRVVYRDPYFSNPEDVPPTAREFGGRRFVLKGDSIKYLPSFAHETASSKGIGRPFVKKRGGITKWEYAARPPTPLQARTWIAENQSAVEDRAGITSQISAPTQINSGFKITSAKGAESAVKEKQHLAILALEVHVNTRGSLLPDPDFDSIAAIFYCLQSDNEDIIQNAREPGRQLGIIAVGEPDLFKKLGKLGALVEVVETESDLLNLLVSRIRTEWDPEIFAGYEVHHSSFGYLIERAQSEYGWYIGDDLGRIRKAKPTKAATANSDRWGFNQSTTLSFTGRHVLPIWRILKADATLQQYTFEHVVYHILRQRTPHFSPATLTEWYSSGVPHKMAQVFKYWLNRVEMDIELIDEGEIISQTCEFARVFGVDFQSVRTRGSQFKVESVMSRIAKPESFLLLSPDRYELGRQNAAECIPLIMEPKSAFYKGPLLVLDFQSLYPSVMIAYNYCYSTCLGRVELFKGTKKLGISTSNVPPGALHLLRDDINISPNGLMFVKADIRRSLLAKMLTELLETRVMVKSSMKGVKEDKALLKLMNARQLGLKLLANVTYGYTSATFSGRMPCVEIADAIVQTGRETLERALATIRSTPAWGAEVVYGDTDSLFVYLPGKSKEDAFRIGQEIANFVTSQNPRPIKLKFEKVYLPCVLLAKKRYVGFKYEHLSDTEPEFDAKGIETVRRDGIPAVQKMQEHCLKLLFRTQDLSQIKAYCQNQWKRLMLGQVSAQDFTFAKEVRLGTYSSRIPPPPGAAVSARKMKLDRRAEPEYAERVPYVIVQAEPGLLLVHKTISPEEFLADTRLRLDAEYYIRRTMIPPLQRIFDLVGADVAAWYNTMPKLSRLIKRGAEEDVSKKRVVLDEHFLSARCIVCESQVSGSDRFCEDCLSAPSRTIYDVNTRSREVEVRLQAVNAICSSCSNTAPAEKVECDSLNCSTLYSRLSLDRKMAEMRDLLRESMKEFD